MIKKLYKYYKEDAFECYRNNDNIIYKKVNVRFLI